MACRYMSDANNDNNNFSEWSGWFCRDEKTLTMEVDRETDGQQQQQQPAILLDYSIDDNPPWHLCILLAFQVYKHHSLSHL